MPPFRAIKIICLAKYTTKKHQLEKTSGGFFSIVSILYFFKFKSHFFLTLLH